MTAEEAELDALVEFFNLTYGLEHGKGWYPIVLPLLRFCQEHHVKVNQVKEKFGGLRFYYGFEQAGDPRQQMFVPPADAVRAELEQRIDAAEAAALTTCEFCGAAVTSGPRQRKTGFWMKTLCDACWETW